MSPTGWLFVLSAIPIASYSLIRRFKAAIIVASALGLTVLWCRMIWLEKQSQYPDIDIIFELGCLFWGIVLIVWYVLLIACSALTHCLIRRVVGRPRTGPSPSV